MIHVVASIRIKEGHRAAFLELFKANVPAVLAEEGCIEYAPTVDASSGLEVQDSDEHRVTAIEKWDSLEALRAHLEAPHMLAFREQSGHLVESVSLQILENA
ncbi:MAG: antibiotic biosynthesis monooxygenase [Opitutales bacterium TMED158]|nr:MAG: antibiotic biosynthesis monooxygenase [Opitutales bacterium TMED158]